MPILHDAVFSSTSWNGLGIFEFNRISNTVKFALKATTKRQRHRFKKFGVVPVPVLEAMWLLDWLPGDNAPKQGMKIPKLTDYLCDKRNKYKNAQAKENGKWLWETIIKEEKIGRRIFVKKVEFPTFTIKISLESGAKSSVRAR